MNYKQKSAVRSAVKLEGQHRILEFVACLFSILLRMRRISVRESMRKIYKKKGEQEKMTKGEKNNDKKVCV